MTALLAFLALMLAAFFGPVFGLGVLSIVVAVRMAVVVGGGDARPGLLVHYTGVLVYLALAPFLQFLLQATFWGAGLMDPVSGVETLAIVACYIVGVEVGYGMRYRAPSAEIEGGPAPVPFIVVAMVLFAIGLVAIKPNLAFTLRTAQVEVATRTLDSLLFSVLPKQMILTALAGLLVYFAAVRRNVVAAWLTAVVLLLSLATVVSPSTTPRQMLLTGLLPLVMLAPVRERTKAVVLVLVLAAGFFGVGGVVNSLTRGSQYNWVDRGFPLSPDFDAFYNMVQLIQYSGGGRSLGSGAYTANAFSFLLPRELKLFPWADPLQTSWLSYFSQRNVSLPPLFTTYLDFSLFGPLVLGGVVGRVLRHVDAGLLKRSPMQQFLGWSIIALYVPFLRGPVQGMGVYATVAIIVAVVLATAAARPAAVPSMGVRGRA